MLRHVVIAKFKDGLSESVIAELEKGLKGLPQIIPEIVEFQCGKDVLRSQRSYDFALVSSFADLDALKRYQVHPAHKEVAVKLMESCESVILVDFEV
jgi:hypothetical protein